MYHQAGARYDVRPNHDLASMAILVNAGSTPARFTGSRVVSPNAKYGCHGDIIWQLRARIQAAKLNAKGL
jgi:hypothetical protein